MKLQTIRLNKSFEYLPIEKIDYDASHLEIIAESIFELPKELENCKDLVSLKVMSKNLHVFPSHLLSLPKLKILKIKNGRIQKIDDASIPSASPLSVLQIIGNELELFPSSFCLLKSLEELDLSSNKLKELPSKFDQLNKIRRLSLNSNLFEDIPKCLYKLTNLTHLALDKNLFKSEIKDKIQKDFNIWL